MMTTNFTLMTGRHHDDSYYYVLLTERPHDGTSLWQDVSMTTANIKFSWRNVLMMARSHDDSSSWQQLILRPQDGTTSRRKFLRMSDGSSACPLPKLWIQ